MTYSSKAGWGQYLAYGDLYSAGRQPHAMGASVWVPHPWDEVWTAEPAAAPVVITNAAKANATVTSGPVLTTPTVNQYWVAGTATTLTLAANTFTDTQGLALTYSATLASGAALPTWLKFTAATDSFSGTDPAGTGPVTLRVTATDTAGLAVSESFTISLAQAPKLYKQTATQYFAAGTKQSFTLAAATFTDPQNATLSYAATLASGAALPSWLSFNANTRTFSGTDAAGTAAVSVKVTATDTYGLSSSETFGVALASAPTVSAQTATQYWLAGKATTFVLPVATFTDPQGLLLSYAATLASGAALPTWLTFNASTHSFSGTDPSGTATVAVKVTATDSVGLAVAESFNIALATAPTVTTATANQYWVAGKATTLALPAGTFVDPQGLAMTYSATLAGGAALPSWLKFTAATDTFSGTDATGTAPVTVTVTAKDSAGATGAESFTISLAAAPTVANATAAQSWTQGQAVNFTLPANTFTDPQGAALTYSASLSTGAALPSWLVFNAATDSFSGTEPVGTAAFSLKLTATDSYGLATSETFAVSTPIAGNSGVTGASPFVINVTYDSSVAAAPAGFKTAVAAAVSYLESEFTNATTLNLTIGYGSVNGSALPSGDLGANQTSYDVVSYATLQAALAANGTQPDQVAALAGLPATSPMGTANFIIANAEAKALGLSVGIAGVNDGYVGLSSAYAMSFDPANRAVAGSYDAIGVLEHEITEVMGRTSSLGTYAGMYEPLDLFRYTSAGVRDLVPGAGSFAVDGTTLLQSYNASASAGDLGDWAASVTGDSFGNGSTGVAGLVTAVDLREMNVLGWTRASLTA